MRNARSHLLRKFYHINNNLSLFIVALVMCFVIVILQTILVVIPYSQAISVSNKSGSCNCIVFRMDDIQDYWIRSGQIGPMNVSYQSSFFSISIQMTTIQCSGNISMLRGKRTTNSNDESASGQQNTHGEKQVEW